MLRKIAVAAAAKPAVEIRQEGESFFIRTCTPVRTTEVRFRVGREFDEQTVDGRPCKVRGGGRDTRGRAGDTRRGGGGGCPAGSGCRARVRARW